MSSWRLNWSIKALTNTTTRKRNAAALENPWLFYIAIIVKLVPGLYKGPLTLELKNGGAFQVREFMTLFIYHEIFLDGEYDGIPSLGREPRILDVGGNTGLFALRMMQLYGNAKIHTFEPYRPNYDQLETNIRLSNSNNIFAHPKGVDAKSGQKKLYIHPKNIGGHSIFEGQAGSNVVVIDLISLKEALALLEDAPCDLLKLDCEGAEKDIILSMTQDISGQIRRIICETTPQLYDEDVLVEHLKGLGYTARLRNRILYAEQS